MKRHLKPVFDVGLNISKSGNYTNLCTGPYPHHQGVVVAIAFLYIVEFYCEAMAINYSIDLDMIS